MVAQRIPDQDVGLCPTPAPAHSAEHTAAPPDFECTFAPRVLNAHGVDGSDGQSEVLAEALRI